MYSFFKTINIIPSKIKGIHIIWLNDIKVWMWVCLRKSNINLLIENNSSKYICVQAQSESINGYMMSAIMSDDVQAGKKAYADMSSLPPW